MTRPPITIKTLRYHYKNLKIHDVFLKGVIVSELSIITFSITVGRDESMKQQNIHTMNCKLCTVAKIATIYLMTNGNTNEKLFRFGEIL